jgi:hypothetical protein
MNSRSFHPLLPVLAAVWLLAGAPAGAQTSAVDALLACQKLADAGARLACYDREVPRLAPAPRATGSVPTAPAATAAPPPVPAAAAEARFGLSAKPEDSGPAQITSTLPDGFSGWRAGQRIQLGNGQVWRIADDSSAFVNLKSPRVVVRQGALGAFYLDFDGDKRSPRVRRVE